MSLLVSSSAAGGLRSLDGLLTMMAKSGGGRQLVVAAMEALAVSFVCGLPQFGWLCVRVVQAQTVLGAGCCVTQDTPLMRLHSCGAQTRRSCSCLRCCLTASSKCWSSSHCR